MGSGVNNQEQKLIAITTEYKKKQQKPLQFQKLVYRKDDEQRKAEFCVHVCGVRAPECMLVLVSVYMKKRFLYFNTGSTQLFTKSR